MTHEQMNAFQTWWNKSSTRKLQVTLQPCRHPSLEGDWRDLSVEVVADGRTMTTSHTIRTSDFEDDFGAMMREAERLIRRSIKEVPKNTP